MTRAPQKINTGWALANLHPVSQDLAPKFESQAGGPSPTPDVTDFVSDKFVERIKGLVDHPILPLDQAYQPLNAIVPGLDVHHAVANFASYRDNTLSQDEAAAVYVYTLETALYRKLNASLRSADREALVRFYFSYLRLFLSTLDKLPRQTLKVWRGVALDLKTDYPIGGKVTWHGVSSCTTKKSAALGRIQYGGTLFYVHAVSAVSISKLSAIVTEEEYLLAPGTRLLVDSISIEDDITTITLRELGTCPD
jgi:hypothetical protein